jgi:hypothetical protein
MQKFLDFLEVLTQKKNVAKNLIQNGRYIQDGDQNYIFVCWKEILVPLKFFGQSNYAFL